MTLWDAGDPTVDPAAAPAVPQPEPEHTWSLPELGRAVKRALATSLPSELWVRAEIRGTRPANRAGHRYFDLVCPGATPDARPLAKFGAVLFKGDAPRVHGRLAAAGNAARLADGVEVRVRVRVAWWAPGGQLNLVVTDIDPAFTLGQLEAQRAAVLASLQQAGLLGRNAGAALSPLPLRVGLVTAANSAAHADFVHELAGSGYRFRVRLLDTPVQGAAAPRALARALASFPPGSVDVVAVVRGGGARTDLAAFDGEAVARAVATCPVPVFCGIGHEIDRSVVDQVAHTSAKTPTACAAALVAAVTAAHQRAEERWAQVAQVGLRHLARADATLRAASAHTARTSRRAVQAASAHTGLVAAALGTAAVAAPARAATALAQRSGRLQGATRRHLAVLDERLERAAQRLATSAPRRTQIEDARLAAAQARVAALDPARLLARGWSITRDANGRVVRTATDVSPAAVLVTTVRDGTVTSTVTATERSSSPTTGPAGIEALASSTAPPEDHPHG